MTATYRLRGIGWFGGVVIVSLGFYLVSLQVAAERKRLAQVDAKIAVAERDIRALETEFNVRANLAQLERWNGDTLSLVAPTAGQFVRDEAQLAAISFTPGASTSAQDAGIRTAQLIVPSLPNDSAPIPAPAAMAAAVPAGVQVAAKPAAARPASVQVAAATTAPDRPAAIKASLVTTADAPATASKARAVAMLDRSLLSDSTIGDLMSGAQSEARRLR